ncbi:uncharacterized protein METZ01_LOCUS188713, partial [marine metagenome]
MWKNAKNFFNMKKILFLFSFFLFFLINPKIAFSLTADFTSHPCFVNF